MQSAYRSFYSTETALLRVQNDLVNSIGKNNLAAMVLLDLSAAFDTLLFTLYVSPVADITQHNVGNMFYADDTQLYVSISPRDINNSPSLAILDSCLSAIKTWMGNNMLKLNDVKTELLLLGSPYFIRKNQDITIAVGDSCIESVSAVRNLGAFFDEYVNGCICSQKLCCYSRAT